MNIKFENSGASFSEDRRYRYSLWRWWRSGNGQECCFIMLNPSTADENTLDPTVTRCVRYAHDWGYSGLVVANIFALRSTDPKELYRVDNPVGPDNDEAILAASLKAGCVVAAWGTHGALRDRGERVSQLLEDFNVCCLGMTKAGHPKHPLYLRRDAERIPYSYRLAVAV